VYRRAGKKFEREDRGGKESGDIPRAWRGRPDKSKEYNGAIRLRDKGESQKVGEIFYTGEKKKFGDEREFLQSFRRPRKKDKAEVDRKAILFTKNFWRGDAKNWKAQQRGGIGNGRR